MIIEKYTYPFEKNSRVFLSTLIVGKIRRFNSVPQPWPNFLLSKHWKFFITIRNVDSESPGLFIHGISLMQWETKGGLFGGILYGCSATGRQFNLPRIYHGHIEMSRCREFMISLLKYDLNFLSRNTLVIHFKFASCVARLIAIAWQLSNGNIWSRWRLRRNGEEDDEVRWCHPTKQVRVCQYRSILSIVWWGEIILIIYVFCRGRRKPDGRSILRINEKYEFNETVSIRSMSLS